MEIYYKNAYSTLILLNSYYNFELSNRNEQLKNLGKTIMKDEWCIRVWTLQEGILSWRPLIVFSNCIVALWTFSNAIVRENIKVEKLFPLSNKSLNFTIQMIIHEMNNKNVKKNKIKYFLLEVC